MHYPNAIFFAHEGSATVALACISWLAIPRALPTKHDFGDAAAVLLITTGIAHDIDFCLLQVTWGAPT